MIGRCLETARVTLTGDRDINQDRCAVLSHGSAALLVLADGLGGHPRGEVAAQLVVDVCESRFRESEKPIPDPEAFMRQCIESAHHAILNFGDRQTPPICPRTTIVIAIVQCGTLYWAHVGDSRLYLIRDAHILAQTQDHSRVHYVRTAGHVAAKPRTSITRCLGGLDSPPQVTLGAPTILKQDDIVMLCSDGLWGQIDQDDMIDDLADNYTSDLQERLAAIAQRASKESQPASDNVSAIGFRWLVGQCSNEYETELSADSGDQDLQNAIRHLRGIIGDD